ncbi:hypothetical protein IEQ34_021046 [Dendrobium chrysotoxum]|uniref:Uncharacterized protein n=1 Tax=Dendrobium chrysotoxum TaxID=161865 RepID=A0AAV7G329_DENCH|nr:hypothetical protein IEQ34_021046 [Dendrobium chrysotoxum]
MHGHSVMECFILHLYLCKQKESTKEEKGKANVDSSTPLVDDNTKQAPKFLIDSNPENRSSFKEPIHDMNGHTEVGGVTDLVAEAPNPSILNQ